MCALNSMILLKCPHFLRRLTIREVPHTFRLTDKKVSKYIVRGCSSSEVGSVLTYVEKVTTS